MDSSAMRSAKPPPELVAGNHFILSDNCRHDGATAKSGGDSWWQSRTRTERILCSLLILCGLLICGLISAVLLVLLRSSVDKVLGAHTAVVEIRGSGRQLCVSEACTKAAMDILETIDQQVDPCQNFYGYACGGWLKRNAIPEDKGRYSIFTQAKESLELVLKQVLEKPVDPYEMQSTADAKRMYHACMNESVIEELGSRPAIDLLNAYLVWPLLQTDQRVLDRFEREFDWVETVARLRRDGGTYLITTAVWADSRNTSTQIIHIDQPSVGMPSTEYMTRGRDDKYVTAYLTFMTETAVMLGADPVVAVRDCEAVLDFEVELAKIKTPREQRRDAVRQYNKMTLRELQAQTKPALDWMKYFTIVLPADLNPPLTPSEAVIVQEPDFFNKLVDLMEQSPKRVIANYLGWRIAQSVIWDLDSHFREILNRYRNVLHGTSMEKSRWRTCVGIVTGYFDMAVGRLYVEHNLANGSREQAEKMIDDISEAFLGILVNETDWMDQPAKLVAEDKARAISRKIGYPDMIHNATAMAEHFRGQVGNDSDHFGNVLINSRVMAQKNFKEMRDAFDKNKWAVTPAEVNAFYSTDYNCITFPAGILQPPFFDKDRPQSLNYGALGMVIGHEITHGFDDQGRQKDKEGNLRDWWSSATVEAFKNQTRCIVDQYSGFYIAEVNMTLNGVNTQGENIADNGGLKQAYRAYDQWRKRHANSEPLLPGLLHVTHDQLFFLSYAHIWCGLARPDAYANDILSGVHSPDKYRVEGPIKNSMEFASAFHCPVGTPMNPPVGQKCKVW